MITATLVDGVLCWKNTVQVDDDGDPECYHPDSKSGRDKLANALHNTSEYASHVAKGLKPPSGWAGIATDPHGDPIIQGETPPPIVLSGGGLLMHAPHSFGFYVATTSYADKRFPLSDPCRYLNAQKVRYVTYTNTLERMGAMPGDLAVLLSLESGLWCTAILGDYGPDLGEASVAACLACGGPADPRHGGPKGLFACAVFPDSSGPWPRSDDEISSQVAAHFAPWGGLDRLKAI